MGGCSFRPFRQYAGPDNQPLSRGQFFRQLKIAGIEQRDRAQNPSGKRPYVCTSSSSADVSERNGTRGSDVPG